MLNPKLSLKAFLGLALFASVFSDSRAQLLTFDTLSTFNPIPNGYGGLNWVNFETIAKSIDAGSGFEHGTVSPNYTAFNAFGNPSSISSADSFSLTSLYLTAAWRDGLSVKIVGLLNGTELYNNTYVVSTYGPTFELLNYVGVNEVRFEGSGGVHHNFAADAAIIVSGDGPIFAIDNMQLNGTPVPEPSTYELWGAIMLLGLVAVRRRAVNK